MGTLDPVTRTVLLGEPPPEVGEWLERRAALGQDRFDEVWEGEYHVAPAARSRHGLIDDQLGHVLRPRAVAAGLVGSGPLNLGEPDDYRVPDRVYLRAPLDVVFVPSAVVVVEIVSPDDETHRKFDFYFRRGVEELLVVDPDRRTVQWYRRADATFEPAERSDLLDLAAATLHAELDWPG